MLCCGVCVCVCMRERERESLSRFTGIQFDFFQGDLAGVVGWLVVSGRDKVGYQSVVGIRLVTSSWWGG